MDRSRSARGNARGRIAARRRLSRVGAFATLPRPGGAARHPGVTRARDVRRRGDPFAVRADGYRVQGMVMVDALEAGEEEPELPEGHRVRPLRAALRPGLLGMHAVVDPASIPRLGRRLGQTPRRERPRQGRPRGADEDRPRRKKRRRAPVEGECARGCQRCARRPARRAGPTPRRSPLLSCRSWTDPPRADTRNTRTEESGQLSGDSAR